jgi:hypothetical protein
LVVIWIAIAADREAFLDLLATWEAQYGTEIAAVPQGHIPALRTVFFGDITP